MARLKVLLASSEVVPFAKTGGLADVAGSLPLALEELGVDVRVIMPKYASVKAAGDFAKIGKSIKVYFVENEDYFNRKELYADLFGDYKDNLDRFAFFSREILARCRKESFAPDVIHCNDWQTALIPVYLNTIYKYDPFFANTRTLYTIHNMAYQGLFPKEEFPKIGLDWALFHIDYFEFYDKVNLMKAGLVYSDAVSTVSPTYAKEILTREFGCGLEGVLKTRENALFGILNGIDYNLWSPEKDAKILKNYSVDSLQDKYLNKEMFQKEMGIKVFIGHKADNLPSGADLVVYSEAVPKTNPELQQAKKLKIKDRSLTWFLPSLSVILVIAPLYFTWKNNGPLTRIFNPVFYQISEEFKRNFEVLNLIPAEASVGAQSSWVPHLSHRQEIYSIEPTLLSRVQPDYLVLTNLETSDSFYKFQHLEDMKKEFKNRGDYEVMVDDGIRLLLKRKS